jgi:hypothetical protein
MWSRRESPVFAEWPITALAVLGARPFPAAVPGTNPGRLRDPRPPVFAACQRRLYICPSLLPETLRATGGITSRMNGPRRCSVQCRDKDKDKGKDNDVRRRVWALLKSAAGTIGTAQRAVGTTFLSWSAAIAMAGGQASRDAGFC